MPYTVSQVRGSNPDVLKTASADAENSARRVDAQIDQGRAQLGKLAESWTGTAADAAQKEYGERLADQTDFSAKLREVKDTLSTWGSKLVDKRSELDAAVNDAEVWWNVADDGSVTPGVWLSWWAELSTVNALIVEGNRLEVENNIKLVLAQFEADDVAAGRAIRKIGWALT